MSHDSKAAGTHAAVTKVGRGGSRERDGIGPSSETQLGLGSAAGWLTDESASRRSFGCLFPPTQHADTGVHVTQKSFKTDRRDKPKHSGKVGATTGPKKGGGGGRGTWGRPGDEAEDAGQIDPNDPSEKIASRTRIMNCSVSTDQLGQRLTVSSVCSFSFLVLQQLRSR